ncbi:MBL fold metallo-hydrolase [Desulfurococcus mucosus]|uniref:RNA procession exonuclease-like protein n=1 Tax=Desulfurococcus mucosus (strain ATCC 35584 / DSM 2162 / JCM 9187 / O7/1) TaxID=765177 RepID=E8R7U7_DESM0|nr:MBL fold metallo-hydrolase [Desulfurococcus mucosus]ADV64573.1 RNA procession exonuclease-like protein [Desulfurococcus mucosus DSM 2162]
MLTAGDYRRLLELVYISEGGAVVLGRNISADGHADKPVRVVTHAHIDHLKGLEESIRFSKTIVGTAVTLDLVEALNYVGRDLLPYYRLKRKPIGLNECMSIEGDRMCLLPASHIPGSAQVYVEHEGFKLGYTGDFKLGEGTVVMKGLDALVIEATYGNPKHRRPFKDVVPEMLAYLVEEGLARFRRVYIYGYHGKLQEAMLILRERGVEAPFVLPRKIFNATRLLEKHGFKIGNYVSEETGSSMGEGVVVFKHMNTAEYRRLDGGSLHIVLSGWEFNEPFRRVDDYTYLIALSDHADFDDLVKYVEAGDPGLVVVDASRDGDAWSLRDALVDKGYCAIVMPSGRVAEQLGECMGGLMKP